MEQNINNFPNFLIKYAKREHLNLQEYKSVNTIESLFEFFNFYFQIADVKILHIEHDTGKMKVGQISLHNGCYTTDYSDYKYGFSVNAKSLKILDKPFILHLCTKSTNDKESNNTPYAVTVLGQETIVNNLTQNIEEPMETWLKNIPSSKPSQLDIIIPSVHSLAYFSTNISLLKPFLSDKVFNYLNDSQQSVLLSRTKRKPLKSVKNSRKIFIFYDYFNKAIKCCNNVDLYRGHSYVSTLVTNNDESYIEYNPKQGEAYITLITKANYKFPYMIRKYIGTDFKNSDPVGFWIPKTEAVFSVQEGTIYKDMDTFIASCGTRPLAIDILILDHESLNKSNITIFKEAK